MLHVLVACEESQAVASAFRFLGHDAYSCDLKPCSGGHPEYHIEGSVIPYLNLGWDLIIAFPPCTYLSNANPRPYYGKRLLGRIAAEHFFWQIWHCDCKHIAIENPVGYMNHIIEPDQVFHPYNFGDPYKKRTCLWLKNLPKLRYTNNLRGNFKSWVFENRDPCIRSKTFPGIAKAMAEQWSDYLGKFEILSLFDVDN